jgi:hypothetical protein
MHFHPCIPERGWGQGKPLLTTGASAGDGENPGLRGQGQGCTPRRGMDPLPPLSVHNRQAEEAI